MSQFLRPSEGPRGLACLDFTDAHGQECSFQESSVADYNGAWLGVDVDTRGERVGCRMHLNQEMARELGQKLIEFAETGNIKGVVQVWEDELHEGRLVSEGHYSDERWLAGVLEWQQANGVNAKVESVQRVWMRSETIERWVICDESDPEAVPHMLAEYENLGQVTP